MLRCPACGFVNQMVDAETAYCPNCGSPYHPDAPYNDLTVPATPSRVAGTPYAPYPTNQSAISAEDRSGRQPLPPSYWSGAGALPPPAVQPKRRTRMGSFITGMLVALGIVVLGICSLAALAAAKRNSSAARTATATPALTLVGTHTGTSTVPLQTFTDPAGYFTISYPTVWQESAAPITSIAGQGTIFTSTDALPKTVVILVTPAPITTDSLPVIIASEHGTGYTPTRAPVYVLINGVRWHKAEGTFTTSNGQFYHAAELVTHQGKNTFVMMLTAPQADYLSTDNTIFLPMLRSFVITK